MRQTWLFASGRLVNCHWLTLMAVLLVVVLQTPVLASEERQPLAEWQVLLQTGPACRTCYLIFSHCSLVESPTMDFTGRHFPKDLILQTIRWYLRYSLSYRDIEEILEERGVEIDHTTPYRWVQEYAPQLEAEHRKRRKPCGTSWRMDETYIKIKGEWVYLYRAVDKEGDTVDFLLTKKRDKKAATRFFKKAIRLNGMPEKVTIDKSGANTAALEGLNQEQKVADEPEIQIRQIKYLNNLVEQDHRGIKRRTKPMLGFLSGTSITATTSTDSELVALWINRRTPSLDSLSTS